MWYAPARASELNCLSYLKLSTKEPQAAGLNRRESELLVALLKPELPTGKPGLQATLQSCAVAHRRLAFARSAIAASSLCGIVGMRNAGLQEERSFMLILRLPKDLFCQLRGSFLAFGRLSLKSLSKGDAGRSCYLTRANCRFKKSASLPPLIRTAREPCQNGPQLADVRRLGQKVLEAGLCGALAMILVIVASNCNDPRRNR